EKPFQDKLNSIKQERASIQQKIMEIKNLAWEKQVKQIKGKSPEELRQMNVSFSQELNKALSPHEKRLSDLDREEAAAIKQLDQLREEKFYLEFTSPSETSKLLSGIREDIRTAARKAASARGIDLVLNSRLFPAYSKPNTGSTRYASADYDRLQALVGGIDEANLERRDLQSFVSSYIQLLEVSQNLPVDELLLKDFLVQDTVDVTMDVVRELLRDSEINQQVREEIFRYLETRIGK
ncbi:MAG: hypothetical protein PHQ23_15915, partial [Candidatus Wallbacteria bacterium]|nr:hypothetical protein [Candidatus Wallbacteria bacterium]